MSASDHNQNDQLNKPSHVSHSSSKSQGSENFTDSETKLDQEIILYLLQANIKTIPGLDWSKKFHQCKISKLVCLPEAISNLPELLRMARNLKTEIEYATRELEEIMCTQDAAKRKMGMNQTS